MKIAILLTGHFRTSNKTCNSFNRFFSNIDKVVFGHAWNTIGHTENVWWSKIGDGNIQKTDSDQIKINYNTENIIVEQIPTFHTDNKNFNSVGGYSAIHGQFQSLQRAYELLEQYENKHNFKFDFIIKTRYDVEYVNEFDFNSLDKDVLYFIKTYHSLACEIYTDIMFATGRENFDKIVKFNSVMDNYLQLAINKHKIIEGEQPFSKYIRDTFNCKKEYLNVYSNIIRLNNDKIVLFKG